MIDITDKACKPTMDEIVSYVGNPLFPDMVSLLESEYGARLEIEYSGDNVLLGWNVKLFRSGCTLCRLYPREGFFHVLVVVGRKEKDRAEALLPQMSETMRKKYESTREGMGQRWLVLTLEDDDRLYHDVLQLVRIRRG